MKKSRPKTYQTKKNNGYNIQMHKQRALLHELTRTNVAQIYACFFKALREYGNSDEDIENLFSRTQEIWNELVDTPEMRDMIQLCESATGVTLAMGD